VRTQTRTGEKGKSKEVVFWGTPPIPNWDESPIKPGTGTFTRVTPTPQTKKLSRIWLKTALSNMRSKTKVEKTGVTLSL